MLFVLFQLGQDRYALDTSEVNEVLPLVKIKRIPQAVRGVAGIFDYHGTPVPVIDLAELSLGTPSRLLMSTRIILVNYLEETGETHLLGLLAEQATGTISRVAADFTDSGIVVEAAAYLGPVTTDESGIIQRVEVGNLLSSQIRDQLLHPG